MRRLAIFLTVVLALAAGGFFGFKQYKSWRQKGLIEKARACMEKADYRNASLCARQAVKADPADVGACRVLADLAEIGRSTNALFWRRRVLELEPQNPDNLLGLARTALMLGNRREAVDALNAIKPEHRGAADYHKLRGNLSWTLGNLAEAEIAFNEAARLEPTNAITRMNLNLVRLVSTNAENSRVARTELETLAQNPSTRADVLRQLCIDAIQQRQFEEAARYSGELLKDGGGTPSDQLQHLRILRESNPQGYSAHLKNLQAAFSTNALQAAVLARWMIAGSSPQESLTWTQTLPEDVRGQPLISAVQAEALLALSDWPKLEKHLEAGEWGQNEFIREQLLARASREMSNESGERTHWLRAMKAASGNLERLKHLAQTAESWGWQAHMEEALNAILSQFPEQRWAEEYLSALYHRGGRTQALQNLFARKLEREPTNVVAKSNCATLGILLDPADKKAHALAEEAASAEPNDPFVASTYALSLYFQKRLPEALQVMEKLPSEKLERPVIAVWHGFLLREAGQTERAEKYLKLGEKAPLLPEEQKLLALRGPSGG